jgi:hypothetical protein
MYVGPTSWKKNYFMTILNDNMVQDANLALMEVYGKSRLLDENVW